MKTINIWATHHTPTDVQLNEIGNHVKLPQEIQDKLSFITAEDETELTFAINSVVDYIAQNFRDYDVINIYQLAGTVDASIVFYKIINEKAHLFKNVYLFTSVNECKREEINGENGVRINKTYFVHKRFRKITIKG